MQTFDQTKDFMNNPQFQTGITQPPGIQPKKVIKIYGQEYVLCKDASDPTTSFPHQRVKIQAGDCIHVKDADLDVFFCYIHGVIQPIPNSLEKPVNVYYVGYHKNYVDMRFITPNDVARMHVYKAEMSTWATDFARNMLGAPSTSEPDREPISPFPEWIVPAANQQEEKPGKIRVTKEEKMQENLNDTFDTK